MTCYPFPAVWFLFTLNIILILKYPGGCKLSSLNLPFHITACRFSLSSQKSAEGCFTQWQAGVLDSKKKRTKGCKFACHRDSQFWPWGFLLRSEKCLQMTWFIWWLTFLPRCNNWYFLMFSKWTECLLCARYFVWSLSWLGDFP